MSNTLTAKEEHFSSLIGINRFTQHNALLEAYKPRKVLSDATIDQMASRIATRVKVASRIQELRNSSNTPKIADLVERKEHASSIMRNNSNRVRDQLAANKLIGDYEGNFVDKDKSAQAPVSFTLIIGEKVLNITTVGEEPKALEEGKEDTDTS